MSSFDCSEGERTYVSCHAQADDNQDSLGVGKQLPPGDESLANSRTLAIPANINSLLDVLLLGIGNVQEPTVGGVEECNTKGKPDAHDPELGNFGHQRTIDVASCYSKPVTMK